MKRGLSINNAILEMSMLPGTVLSKRIVRDHVIAKGLQPHTIKIEKPIMPAAKPAQQRYTLYI